MNTMPRMNGKGRRRGVRTARSGNPSTVRSTGPARAATRPRIPRGYEAVDPRTARRVPLWQELSPANPLFPGDPPFTFDIATTIAGSGYLLERITSLGTHTGTHVSAPSHVIEGAATLGELDERWTLMPLAVIDVREQVATSGGDFVIDVARLRSFERQHGRIPAGGCVLLLTGFSTAFALGAAPGPTGKGPGPTGKGPGPTGKGPGPTGEGPGPAPGFSADAVSWLFRARTIMAVGSDTFGPDATSDEDYTATATALRNGGITVENVGPGLTRMRPSGDWVSINGGRPRFSGFPVGITGFTLR